MYRSRYIGIFNEIFNCVEDEILAQSKIALLGCSQACAFEVAAEQKARVTYDNILRLSDDPDVNDVIKFLRQREIVHYQRFGEAMRSLTE